MVWGGRVRPPEKTILTSWKPDFFYKRLVWKSLACNAKPCTENAQKIHTLEIYDAAGHEHLPPTILELHTILGVVSRN